MVAGNYHGNKVSTQLVMEGDVILTATATQIVLMFPLLGYSGLQSTCQGQVAAVIGP